MRTFGWGLFAALVAILALVMTVHDDYQTKTKKMDCFEQVEALTMPAVVPVARTAMHQDKRETFVLTSDNRWTAVHGKEVLADAFHIDFVDLNRSYTIETSRRNAIAPRQQLCPQISDLLRAPLSHTLSTHPLFFPKGVTSSLVQLVV